MHVNFRFTIGMLLSIFVFSIFVIQARSEETSGIATSTETTSIETAEVATSTETAPIEAVETNNIQTTDSQPQAIGETVLPATLTPLQDNSFPIGVLGLNLPQASSTQASSTLASTTPAANNEPLPLPEKEFILQPSVALRTDGSAVDAHIQIQNLSCRTCEKSLKDTNVIAYYTTWYPNDGEIKEIGPSMDEMSFVVSNLANWGEYETQWSSHVPTGHYYFVVITDPENLNNLYTMYRSEFTIQ